MKTYPIMMKIYDGRAVDAFKIAFESDLYVTAMQGKAHAGKLLTKAQVQPFKVGPAINDMLRDKDLREAVKKAKLAEGDKRYSDL